MVFLNSSPFTWRTALAFLILLLQASTPVLSAAQPSIKSSKDQPEAIRLGAQKTVLLPQALNEGLIENPRAAAFRRQLGITKSELIRATQFPNPSILMDSGFKAEFTYRYGFFIPMEPPWKFIFRIAAAKNEVKQTSFEIIQQLWDFRASVRRAYMELVVANELYRTFSDLADLTEHLHQVTKKRLEAGEIAELDVYRAEQAAVKALANKEQQRFLVREAEQRLAVLLGRVPETPVIVPLLPPDGPKPEAAGILPEPDEKYPSLQACLKESMKHRPALRVVHQAVRTNTAKFRRTVGDILPNPALGIGSSVVNGPALAQGAPPGSNIFHGFFVQVFQELPVLDFQQGDLAMYRATGNQLQAEIQAQENIAAEDVATAYQRLFAAKRKIEIYQDRLLSKTIEIVRLARLRYEVGESDLNEVLLAQQAAIEIKTEYLSVVLSYQQAFTDLERSIGIPLQ